MQPFTRFPSHTGTEPPQTNPPDPSAVPGQPSRMFIPTLSGARLSQGVSIKGSVKLVNSLLIDGEVEGTIDSTGTLTLVRPSRSFPRARARSGVSSDVL
jgi:hypothetical protein